MKSKSQKYILGIISAFCIASANAEITKITDLDKTQVKYLTIAYGVALEDGYNPKKLQGLLMQESKAGAHSNYKESGPTNSRYYGVGQIKYSTAVEVIQNNPSLRAYVKSLSKNDVIHALKHNAEFAIRVTSKYLLQVGNGVINEKAITAYNRGPGGVKAVNPKTFHYTKSVMKYAQSDDIAKLNSYLRKRRG